MMTNTKYQYNILQQEKSRYAGRSTHLTNNFGVAASAFKPKSRLFWRRRLYVFSCYALLVDWIYYRRALSDQRHKKVAWSDSVLAMPTGVRTKLILVRPSASRRTLDLTHAKI